MQTKINVPLWVQEVMFILREEGHISYVVGGAVRDSLLGRPVKDWDLTTDARPETVVSIFESLSVPVLPTGIAHGTVTVMHSEGSVEVTTFRRDVSTDGRNATVQFSKNSQEDAGRRDFTINALYATMEGSIYDPTGHGLEDIQRSWIHFVGNPDQRIQEDTLRILRAVRFASQLGFVLSSETIDALWKSPSESLLNLSNERVFAELSKINYRNPKLSVWLNLIKSKFERFFGCELNFRETWSSDLPWYFYWMDAGVRPQFWMKASGLEKKVSTAASRVLNMDLNEDSWFKSFQFGLDETRDLQEYFSIRFPDVPNMPFFRKLPEIRIPNLLGGDDVMDLKGPERGEFLGIALRIHCEYDFRLAKDELMRLTRIKYDQRSNVILKKNRVG